MPVARPKVRSRRHASNGWPAAALLLVACSGACSGAAGPGDGGTGAPPPDLFVVPPDFASPDGSSSLIFAITDDDTGRDLPVRVLVTAVAPTPDVRFDRNAQGEVTNGETATDVAPGVIGSPEGVILVGGTAQITIAPGSYDLFITHGPEWEADSRRVTVAPGQATAITTALRRTVDTRGWISADLHVHTMNSFDSKLQRTARVASEVSVGVEAIVATDHNVVTDLSPEVAQFGYGDLARAFIGDEFNFVEGHGGAYPMPYDGSLPDNGLDALHLDWDHVRLVHGGDIFRMLHALPTRPAVTVNHPRLLPDLGYFTNLGWDPPMPLADAGTFDALEVLSGYMQAPEELAELLRDWFFLLSTGTRVTGLGSSDTHRLRDVRAGFPRSWLRIPADKPGDVTGADIAAAIIGGRALASNGPWALLTIEGGQVGDLIRHPGPTANCQVTVDAPAWIPLDNLRIYVNGELAAQQAIAPGKRPVFEGTIPLQLPAGDAWVVLQVGGPTPMRQDLIGEHGAGRVLPFAITSPVYLDRDGDGAFKPALASLAAADPGPIAPLGAVLDPAILELLRDPRVVDTRDILRAPFVDDARRAEELRDCQPPPWTEAANLANP